MTILRETLGDRLVSKRIDEMERDGDLDQLPSPAQLKGRFLLKASRLRPIVPKLNCDRVLTPPVHQAKNKFLNASDGTLPIAVSPGDDSSSEHSSYSSSDGDFNRNRCMFASIH